jgi:hypothetical protein
MSSVKNEVQKALYNLVKEGIKPVDIYDGWAVPQGQKLPYVVMLNSGVNPDDTKTEHGYQLRFSFHVWSKERGSKEAGDITEKIRIALHDKKPLVTGFDVTNCIWVETISVDDPFGASQEVSSYLLTLTTQSN